MQAKHSIQDYTNIVHHGISKYFDAGGPGKK